MESERLLVNRLLYWLNIVYDGQVFMKRTFIEAITFTIIIANYELEYIYMYTEIRHVVHIHATHNY